MSVLRWISLLLLFLVGLPARAGDVFLFRHPTQVPASQINTLENTLTALGAVVDTTTSSLWPTDYSGYKLVILLGPNATFSSAQLTALEDFINDGGRLVVSGDYEYSLFGAMTVNPHVNTLTAGLGVDISINSTIVDNFLNIFTGTCEATTAVSSDTLTDGVSDLWLIASNSLTLSGDAYSLAEYGGSTVLAVDQPSSATSARDPYDVIVAADYDLLTDYCPGLGYPGDNITFWENLYIPDDGGCDDADGDGFEDEACGGDDCDDTDGDINPDAAEACDGVDEDCDDNIDEDATDATTWYADDDSDTYGDSADTQDACTQPSGYVADDTDCDDTDGAIFPGAEEVCNTLDDDCDTSVDEEATDLATWYADDDSDTFGDADNTQVSCDQPSGYVADSTDCDDGDGAIFPGADETCNDTDDDCDTDVDEDASDVSTWYADDDSDTFGDSADTVDACEQPPGYVSDSTDCDDTDSSVFPGAEEICNSLDDDCDTAVDEDATDLATWYADDDSDTFGDSADTQEACEQPSGYVADSSDCDDSDGDVFPGADETCNDTDDDCDTDIDEDAADVATWYTDADTDGFGDADDSTQSCDQPSGTVSDSSDCDDTDGSIFPGADESCNDVDDDCDTDVDEDALDVVTWYEDLDEDTFGDPDSAADACDQPSGYVADDTDCDDTDGAIFPGAEEVCNTLDDDCDDNVDEGATDVGVWYVDADTDGFGDPGDTQESCEQPDGYVSNSTDCDDSLDSVYPGADETCNDTDDDCDTDVDEDAVDVGTWYPDSDSDTYVDASGEVTGCDQPDGYTTDSWGGEAYDCDDSNGAIFPGAEEVCNTLDDDCDDNIDEGATDLGTWYADDDSDTYGDSAVTQVSCEQPSGYVANSTDCDDTDGAVFPGADEACNDTDDDCDDTVDEDATDASAWYADDDSDTFGDSADTVDACEQPDGYVSDSTDCDDTLDSVYPGADETCNDADDDCDTDIDEDAADADLWYADADADGYGDPGAGTLGCDQPEDHVGNSEDCDDTDAALNQDDADGDEWSTCAGDCDDEDPEVSPEATEVAYDGVDNDCLDGDLTDVDGDGYDAEIAGGDDCADLDADVNPGSAEGADGVDEDCDDTLDESTDWYDDDGDGYAEAGGDCDDDDAGVNPSIDPEVCDGVDEDCDDVIDEGTECFDDDGDGFSEEDGDCNDGAAEVSPGGAEVADNGVDDDCDGVVDAGLYDGDGDGYAPAGGDCDDGDAGTFPGAEEIVNGVDEDCDELVDEGTPFFDDDGDGYSEDEGDCDDSEAAVSPEGAESPDGVDEDCDGIVDEGTSVSDDDGDGYSEEGGDCDDDDAGVSPGAEEALDGRDDDCDDAIDEGVDDVDGDGWRSGDGDCDDNDGWVNPGVPEMCDEIDNDCDYSVDEGCEDLNGLEEKGGCGCAAGGGVPGLAWLLPALVVGLARRRRRGVTAALVALGALGAGCSQDFGVNQLPTELSATPAMTDAGTVPAGVELIVPVSLWASGGDVTIQEVVVTNTPSGGPDASAGSWFSFDGALPVVEGDLDEAVDLELRYFSDLPGYHHAVVEIYSDAANEVVSVEVRANAAEGSASVWPTALEFGAVAPGDALSLEVTLTNEGAVDLTLEGASLPEDFSLDAQLPMSLPIGNLVTLPVRFSPTGEGARAGALTLDLGGVAEVPGVQLRGNDCEGGLPEAYDQDGDGWTSCAGDCADGDAAVGPGELESVDGVDEDCDGLVDEGTDVFDDDGDGYTEEDGDCNDGDGAVSPGLEEVAENGIDDDCDGVTDDGEGDLDGDGYTEDGGDCNDDRGTVYPGAPESVDGVDEDCDDVVDEGTTVFDDDGDGFSESQGDCDDSNPEVNPNASEVADWVDNDCDGHLDEGTVNADDDGDGYSENGGDCDDADAEVNPAAAEVADGVDNDCDGIAE